jgi:hypothetical protein
MPRAASAFRQWDVTKADVRPRRSRPEDIIQRAVFEHLALRSTPGVFVFHPANGGWRSPIEAKILKGLGVRAGVPDLIVIKDGQTYALEIKTEDGRASSAQMQAIEELRAAGAHAEVCHGLDRALAVLEGWGLLRGRARND